MQNDILYFDENYIYPYDLTRINGYINPSTGETDWVQPDVFNDSRLIITGTTINCIGSSEIDFINYNIHYTPGNHYIEFFATYDAKNGKKYVSNPIKVDLKAFCDETAYLAYSGLRYNKSKMIDDLKIIAFNDITNKLFDDNIIVGNFKKEGIGFVLLEGKRVITIESIQVDYNLNSQLINVELKDCIGNINLDTLEVFQIEFNTPEHKIILNNNEVNESSVGKIKNYKLTSSEIIVSKQENLFDYTKIKDEEILISKRLKLLDDISDEDEFDERFDEDFF